MTPNVAAPGNPRGLLWLAALVYTAFVIYGSLVPLDFQALPWDEAVARFRAIPFLNLGIGSRADWVANLLLFIPLTYLWMGALAASGSLTRGALATLALIPIATALSAGIEFTQLFFPQRTVSQNDIFAETLGGIIGVLVWWGTGNRFVEWLQAWQRTHSRAVLAERLAWVYLAGLLVYNILPLDLTISVVEIFHKWQEGKVNLIPFGRLPDDAAFALYEIATDVLIWVPLALLWRLDGTRSAWRVWGMTFATAVLLEFLQLFVFSRVSDVTDIFTAAIGAVLGTMIGGRLASRVVSADRGVVWSAWLPLALASGWIVGLLFVFWYPFEFRTDGAFLRERLHLFMTSVPFEAYYYGTEFRAVTEVLHKVLFFIPLGALLAWFVTQLRWTWRGFGSFASLTLIACTAVAINLGRLALPEKHPDSMDIVLQWLGGAMGFAMIRIILSRKTLSAPPQRAVPSWENNRFSQKNRYGKRR
ncbi:MAG: VanZ family protein, partial [Thiobacillus sp.]